ADVPVDDRAAQLRRVGGVDDRRVDVAALERGERGAHVLGRDYLRLHFAPQADALEVLPRVDAGGHRGGVGEGYAVCSAEVSEDQEAVAENVVAIGDGNRVHGRLVGGEEDVHGRAGLNLPRKRARCT